MEEHFGIQKQLAESDLVGQGVMIRIDRFLVKNPLGAGLGLGIQPCCEVPGGLRVKMH